MDVIEAVRTPRAARRYQAKPVPEETVRRVVEAGRSEGDGLVFFQPEPDLVGAYL